MKNFRPDTKFIDFDKIPLDHQFKARELAKMLGFKTKNFKDKFISYDFPIKFRVVVNNMSVDDVKNWITATNALIYRELSLCKDGLFSGGYVNLINNFSDTDIRDNVNNFLIERSNLYLDTNPKCKNWYKVAAKVGRIIELNH